MREISRGTVHMNYFKVLLEAVVFQNTDSKPYSRAEVVFPNLGILAKVHEKHQDRRHSYSGTAMSKNCPSLSPKSSISIFSLQYQHCADSNALNVCRIPSTNSLTLLFPPSPGTSTTPWKTAWQPPCDTHGNRHSICTIGEWRTRRRLLPWSWPGERQRSHQIRSRPATSSQANSRSWLENSWVSWQRTARCRNLRFSWGVSEHSYQKIRSARCGTGTSEVEFTCSKWTAVSGQSPGNHLCLLRGGHTPSGYRLACAWYTKQSWTVK